MSSVKGSSWRCFETIPSNGEHLHHFIDAMKAGRLNRNQELPTAEAAKVLKPVKGNKNQMLYVLRNYRW